MLREVAAAHGATPAQIALAWTVHHPQRRRDPGRVERGAGGEQRRGGGHHADPDEYGALTAAAEAFHPTTGVSTIPALVRARRNDTGRVVGAGIRSERGVG